MAKIKKAGLSASGKIKLRKILSRGQYRIVDNSSQMIEGSSTETRSEDQILDPSKRARLLDITRNLVRNSSLFNTLLSQLTTNVVSTCGGKVIVSTKSEEANTDMRWAFSQWTRNADFYTGDTFNHMLKRVLREYVIGGDVVLIFDTMVEDSGKVLVFESDELVDVSPSEIEKRYGKGSWVSQGKVYSQNGRNIGVVVSHSQRGCQGYAEPNKCYFLKKDPNSNPLDNNWILFSNNWREGRGVSSVSSSISTLHQIEDLVQSELMASRRQAQIFCWLVQNNNNTQQQIPTFDPSLDYQNMTDEEIEKIASEASNDVQTISFNRARENQIVYEALPENYDAKQLQMQHPNSQVQVMVDWLANRAASTLGLSRVFATGNPEDGNWRSNQLFSFPAILELQKSMEVICDWAFNNFVKWGISKGIITKYISSDFMEYVDWSWKGIDTLDPTANENAIQLQLKNMTKSYKDILGSDWKEKLIQIADERKWMLENGITPPQDLMISGGQTDQSKTKEQPTTTNEEIDNG